MSDALIDSLSAALAARPDDVVLRLHLGELLLAAGRSDDAVHHGAIALAGHPESAEARAFMARAVAAPVDAIAAPDEPAEFDWDRAGEEMTDVLPSLFLDPDAGHDDEGPEEDRPLARAFTVDDPGIRLADVGGMKQVKKRLDASFLAPLRNPQLRELYKKSLRGGLLLYGPPGCGKTYLARALAGELQASFLTVSLADVLDMYIGSSERNLQALFATARASAPCVLFLDEVDAIGQKRTRASEAMRTTVNQLLTELDGVASDNEGVYVLAATNQPWDVDPALRRPGRLDRTVLVLPPDLDAREEILRHHLTDRPVERIDARKVAKLTDGYSGADLAHVCDTASERALMDSVATGTPRMIRTDDLLAALGEVRPSIRPWMELARTVALFANASGEYDELAAFLRKQRRS